MRDTGFPVVRDIVLIGGGHAHVSVLRNFGMFPINGCRITLISPEIDTPYSGMLPGLVAGHYTFDEAHIDLGPLATFAGARYLETSVVRLDPDNRLIHCADNRPPLSYDVLSINTGSTPVFDERITFRRHVIPVKPVSGFLQAWQGVKERVLSEPSRRIGIVGAGAGGTEMLLSMQFALAEGTGHEPGRGPGEFHVFTRDADILKTHGDQVQAALKSAMLERGVTIHSGFDVSEVTEAGVSDGAQMQPVDEVIWVTGAEPPDWFAESGLDVDRRGFVAVDAFLRSTSHPDVFGAGDAVALTHDPRPKSGVFAVRQGPVLANNLRARLLGKPLKKYQPQRAFLSLISTGDQYAIASYAGWSIKGRWVWRWKDSIDRAFMKKFNELPAMEQKPIMTMPTVVDVPDEVVESRAPDAMRCGGCGAKVGAAILTDALAAIVDPNVATDGVVLGIGDDAAAIEVPPGKLLVQTVDSFPAMIEDPYVFGRITANHCLGDIYAMGAEPHSALAVVSLPFAPEAKRKADLVQLLAGVQSVFAEAGCRLIGGHTAEAAELTLGLSINGIAKPDTLLRKNGLAPGMALVLTKPIGTGALFAAHGRGKAKGRWISNAIRQAMVSNATAATVLRAHGAVAMTDITGFGLAGHMNEMLKPSGTSATIRMDAIPILQGAEQIVEGGIVSSLQRQNLTARSDIEAPGAVADTARFQLLFDPQTAGGLLAGVPIAHAIEAVAALKAAGYLEAAAIGETCAAAGPGDKNIRII